jgi:hypothetical protein
MALWEVQLASGSSSISRGIINHGTEVIKLIALCIISQQSIRSHYSLHFNEQNEFDVAALFFATLIIIIEHVFIDLFKESDDIL